MWLTRNGKLSSHYCRRRRKPDPLCGQSDKSSMVYFINSRTVVIGLTCPEIYPHTQLSSGITRIGALKVRSIASWQNYIVKCANKSKKPQWTTLIMIDSQAVKNTCKEECWVERVLFLQSDKWHQKTSSGGYPGLSLLYSRSLKLAYLMTRGWLKWRTQNIDYFTSIPADLPKTTILLDNGYHPEKLTQALEEIYPQIMTKIQFELSAKPSKAEKEAKGQSFFRSGGSQMGKRKI